MRRDLCASTWPLVRWPSWLIMLQCAPSERRVFKISRGIGFFASWAVPLSVSAAFVARFLVSPLLGVVPERVLLGTDRGFIASDVVWGALGLPAGRLVYARAEFLEVGLANPPVGIASRTLWLGHARLAE